MSKRITLILDLDSTIISSLTPNEKQPKGLKGYAMDNDYIVYERPGLQNFLDYIFANFNVAVWTAASQDYCLFIVEKIILNDKSERSLKFVLFDYHGGISEKMGMCPKNLELVYKSFPDCNRYNTIIIDDYEEVFGPQFENSYPIHAFKANSSDATEDRELVKLQNKLMLLLPGNDLTKPLMSKITVEKAIKKMTNVE